MAPRSAPAFTRHLTVSKWPLPEDDDEDTYEKTQQNFFHSYVLFVGTSWTTYQCKVLKLKFIMYHGVIHSQLYNWHFPTMVGYCHGGNMPASHDNGISDDNVGDDNNVYLTWSFHEGSCAIRATPFLDVRFLHFQVQLHHGRRSIPAKSGSV